MRARRWRCTRLEQPSSSVPEQYFHVRAGGNFDSLHRAPAGLARRGARGVFPDYEGNDEVASGGHVDEPECSVLIARALDEHVVILGHVRRELGRILLQQDLALLIV